MLKRIVLFAVLALCPTLGLSQTHTGGGGGTGGGANPAGSGSEVQYRSNATTFGAVTGSSVSGGTLTCGTGCAIVTSGSGASTATAMPLSGLTAPGANTALTMRAATIVYNFTGNWGSGFAYAIVSNGSNASTGPLFQLSTGASSNAGQDPFQACAQGTSNCFKVTNAGLATAIGTAAIDATKLSGNLPAISGASLTGITATQVGLGSVTNDAQTKAAIVPNSAPSAGQLLIGNAGGTAYATLSMSGSCTFASTGVISCTHSFGAVFDGGGAALSAGTTYITVPFACTLTAWNILVDTGTATFQVWRLPTGTAIPTVANTLNTSGVSISTGTAVRSTTLSDFAVPNTGAAQAIAANDIIAIRLQTVATATFANLTMECQ